MVWISTKKFKKITKDGRGKTFDLDKLEQMRDEGWTPKFVNAPKFLSRLKYARPVKLVASVDVQKIPFDASACFSCQNCGLYSRHPFCSPDHPNLSDAEKIVKSYDNAVIFIMQNDGSFPWNDDPTELRHIKFRKRVGFALRGAEAGTSRYLKATMKHIEAHARRIGFRAQAFISGHCSLCGQCPVKGFRDSSNRQVPCPVGGMPSLESWWINVYRWHSHGALGDLFKANNDAVWPLTHVCLDYFTLISMLCYDNKELKTYWYKEHYKNRLKDKSVVEVYKKASEAIRRGMKNRKEKGIPI